MRNLLVLFFLILSFSSNAEEKNDTNYLVNLMVTSKVAGMCGVFGQMTRFQESTKMPGGDEFIFRFLNTEVARLGSNLESFMKTCPATIKIYDDTMTLLSKSKE